MKKLIFTLSLSILSFTALGAVNCRSVQLLGNAGSQYILNEVNKEFGNKTYKINRRKKLHIKEATSISFNGCSAKMKVNVAVKRKIRRDAHGYIILKATVDYFDGRKICLTKSKVLKVKLSNTLRLGEATYKLVANKTLPNNTCFNL